MKQPGRAALPTLHHRQTVQSCSLEATVPTLPTHSLLPWTPLCTCGTLMSQAMCPLPRPPPQPPPGPAGVISDTPPPPLHSSSPPPLAAAALLRCEAIGSPHPSLGSTLLLQKTLSYTGRNSQTTSAWIVAWKEEAPFIAFIGVERVPLHYGH